MTWGTLIGLGAAVYALKAAGPLLAARWTPGPLLGTALELLSVPLLAALVLVQTFDGGERLVVDARVPALAVAAVLVWRRAPFLVVVVGAAATAAGVRAI